MSRLGVLVVARQQELRKDCRPVHGGDDPVFGPTFVVEAAVERQLDAAARLVALEAFVVVVGVASGIVDEQVSVGHLAKRSFDETRRTVEEFVEVFGHHDHLKPK